MSFFRSYLVYVFFGFFGVVLVLSLVNPNPFCNAPDSIGDESYFLTSSLHAIQKHTLPGWEFSPYGSYYGGVETYFTTAVLLPIIGIVALATHSIADAELWIALHTGDLLQVIRLLNGLLALLCVGWSVSLYARKQVPVALKQQLLLLFFLVGGSSLFVGLVHSAKVWTIAILLDVSVGALVVANAHRRLHGQEPLVPPSTLTLVLLGSGMLAFFQNFVGIFSIGLWTLWAIVLEQVRVRDLLQAMRRYALVGLAFLVTQASFIYRALFVKSHNTVFDLGQVAPTTSEGSFDWYHRLHDPIVWALQSQPLILLIVIGLAITLWHLVRGSVRTKLNKRYLLIAVLHPLLTYGIFYAGLGFSLFPRYATVLLVACCFSLVMLTEESALFRKSALMVAGVLYLIVNVHAIYLYWQPSSTVTLQEQIVTSYNTPENTFIIGPSAWRLALPLNAESLRRLNARHASMGRFDYLRAHADRVEQQTTFLPTVLIADSPAEEQAYIEQEKNARTVWSISTDCSRRCMPDEMARGACFEVNMRACGVVPQEPNTLLLFLTMSQLGDAYVVREVTPIRQSEDE